MTAFVAACLASYFAGAYMQRYCTQHPDAIRHLIAVRARRQQ